MPQALHLIGLYGADINLKDIDEVLGDSCFPNIATLIEGRARSSLLC